MRYSKPPAGTQINWGHPMTVGLKLACLFNEGSSHGAGKPCSHLFDSVSRALGPNNGGPSGSTAIWASTQHGMSLRWIVENAFYTFPARYQSLQSWSCAFYVLCGSFGTRVVWGTGTNGIEVIINGSGLIWVLKTGAVDMGTSSSGLTAGRFHHVGVSYNGTTLRFYVDGKAAGTASSTQTFTNGRLQVGADGNDFLGLNDTNLFSLWVWDRVVSAPEFQQLAVSPWIMTGRSYSLGPIAAGGGGASKAYYYAQTQGLH